MGHFETAHQNTQCHRFYDVQFIAHDKCQSIGMADWEPPCKCVIFVTAVNS